MIKNRLQWLNTMVTEPYYFFHFLIFFSYISLRISTSSLFSPQISFHILRREIQAFLAFLIFASVKVIREETWEGFMADTLLFGKAFIFLLALYVDYRLALWYMLAFLVLYILAQQPAFPELGAVSTITPLQLETTLVEGDTSRFWLVEFRTLCSSTCVRNSRNFPELSVTYANKNLSFGTVDLGLFPNVAEKFGISLTGNVGVPAYILFENNAEVARFPGLGFEARVSHPPITKDFLSRHFELDRFLLEYVNGK
ncbi:hypothetical protein BVRB_2g032510 [Beta vulgaris subsp. vulgaris]|uniref:uncharacterized protein LOC104885537 n=1 Tax=Beta vulgaris subsp. vulgaris TaxID=3555 RepID=UPI00053FAA3D|nr:uncharacterized protein LOC104885537 [Beta vulgaris subsp. vulgaris]KMT18059.1 hypothetical protein BVRB_2g032510 [Beta vulgaris subsp. vulgaris]